jgi:primosomal protein N'
MNPFLAKCPVCGHSVSSAAAACPGCGQALEGAILRRAFACCDCAREVLRESAPKRCSDCGGAMREVAVRGNGRTKVFGPVLAALIAFVLIFALLYLVLR